MFKRFWSLYRKVNRLPRQVRIEACSLCQLNCRDCYMRKNDKDCIIGTGYLTLENFKNFIKKNPYIEEIELSLSGEIFLNKDLLEIIKYAYKKHITLTAFNGVNFNNVSDEILEALVKYKFQGLTLSIDGARNETYVQYRQNGNLNNVFNNIKKLNDIKEKYNSKFPILQWQYIVFEHNEEDIPLLPELMKELKIDDLYFKLPWGEDRYSTKATNYISKIKLHLIKDKEIKNIIMNQKLFLCLFPWLSPQINWNGELLGCCCSTHRTLGINVFKSSLKKALNTEKIKFMKDVLQGKMPSNDTIQCNYCIFYKKMCKYNKFINEKDIKFI